MQTYTLPVWAYQRMYKIYMLYQ